ncbi:MAG TPA: hypothetical protein PLH98_11340 [Ruminococcus flavefaciens]|nr:hypothetical protein [Ruminococcus flavefaciens]HQM01130.1 hypothetical protein [Ruminococcus flavefaciens]
MSKKDVTFIIGLTILMGVLWIMGELVMGLWIAAPVKVHILWGVGILVLTLIISVWHSMKEDESDLTDPKREKYLRKVRKRQK